MQIEKLSGLIAAAHTPFDTMGNVDCELIARQSELLIQQGVRGVFVSGSTGEGISCSVEERIKVMEYWRVAAGDKLKLIIHIGALSLCDVETLGKRADALGVYAVSVVPPNYFKPRNIEMLVEFCRAAAAAAPHCRFYYYHTGMSGVNLPMPEFLQAADVAIPTLAGIKFNSPDLYEYQNCRRVLDGKYDIVYGVDEFFAGALALGAESFIGSTYNYAAPLYYKIWEDFNAGRQGEVLRGMEKVCRMVNLLVRYGGVACGKATMLAHGLDLGGVRLPLHSLSGGEKREIVAAYRAIMAD